MYILNAIAWVSITYSKNLLWYCATVWTHRPRPTYDSQWRKSWGDREGLSSPKICMGGQQCWLSPQSSGFGGTLLGLVSWDCIKSMSHIIILNQPLLSYSPPYAFWQVADLGESGPLTKPLKKLKSVIL